MFVAHLAQDAAYSASNVLEWIKLDRFGEYLSQKGANTPIDASKHVTDIIEISDSDTEASPPPPTPRLPDRKPALREVINICDSESGGDVEARSARVKREPKREPSLATPKPPTGRFRKADPTLIRITRTVNVAQVVELKEIPARFPVPDVDTAYILNFSGDSRAKKQTKGGKPKGLDAFLKAEDQDSWGKGSNGSTLRDTLLKVLGDIPSRHSVHKCNGGYKCEFFDPTLLAGYERTDAEDMMLTREIFARELIQNHSFASSRITDEHGSREPTPEGLSSEEADKFRSDRAALLAQNKKRCKDEGRRALEDIEWSVLQAKLHSLLPARHQPTRSTFTSADLERILGIKLPTSSSSTSLSAALLSVAPHMAQLSAGVTADPHIEETWKLRRAFAADKSLDLVIDLMQLQALVDPLPRTIWRSIVQDQYINFEKINAAFEVGYDHQDEPKDFAGEYVLVKKEQVLAKRAVKTETEWVRVFAAWRTGFCLLYPHRAAELSGYLKVVTDLFRAVPQDPSVAIRFDAVARDKYAKSP
ncbi:hypothetical protein B0H10DRAFT_2439533 [Mycena sp. CBHHK59/15]|nr:hypothetical protein B0H10DRAFT_2439533 [Mycena sp. CBHHK59/15]